MCSNNELSWFFTNRLSATRYMKAKRIGITEILRRIWLLSTNKTKISESFMKQSTQLNVAAHNCHKSHDENCGCGCLDTKSLSMNNVHRAHS